MIDVHAHVFPDALAQAAVGSLVDASPEHERVTAHYDGTVAGLIQAMDRAAIDISITQPVATKASQVRRINDWVATTASGRIVPFGAMHPKVPDAAEEIARMAEAGIRGFKMHPEYQEFLPDDPAMGAIYDAVVEHGMTILFHAGLDVTVPTKTGTPERFAAVLDGWPRMRVILAHMGGFRLWDEVAEHLVGRHVWLDTSYTLGHLPDADVVSLARAHGVERVLFGTDGPWTDAKREREHLGSLGFDEHELAAILGGNAEKLLGLA